MLRFRDLTQFKHLIQLLHFSKSTSALIDIIFFNSIKNEIANFLTLLFLAKGLLFIYFGIFVFRFLLCTHNLSKQILAQFQPLLILLNFLFFLVFCDFPHFVFDLQIINKLLFPIYLLLLDFLLFPIGSLEFTLVDAFLILVLDFYGSLQFLRWSLQLLKFGRFHVDRHDKFFSCVRIILNLPKLFNKYTRLVTNRLNEFLFLFADFLLLIMLEDGLLENNRLDHLFLLFLNLDH